MEHFEECGAGWGGFAVERRDEHEIAWYRWIGRESVGAVAGHLDRGRRQERNAEAESNEFNQVGDGVDLAGDAPLQP